MDIVERCLNARYEINGKVCADAADEIERLRKERDDLASLGQRIAMELECLLMDCKDNAIVSKWWDSAFEALEQWRSYEPSDR